MWAIVGLGNPGRKYERTRHNAGFMVVDRLARTHGISLKEGHLHASGRGPIAGEDVLIIKPLTYMNRSGSAVRDAARHHPLEVERILVVHDDLDLPPGRMKIKRGGGAGGHKGVASIIAETGTKDFLRLKIGIGRDPGLPSDQHVLSRFRPDEMEMVEEVLHDACEAIVVILKEGAEEAMNRFHRRPLEEELEEGERQDDAPADGADLRS